MFDGVKLIRRKYISISEVISLSYILKKGTADTPGGLGAILTQKDQFDNYYAISYASRQLKDHEKNYSPFLLESAAAVWGMDVFNEYLKGKKFILFTDHKPLEKMGHLHTKTMEQTSGCTSRARLRHSV